MYVHSSYTKLYDLEQAPYSFDIFSISSDHFNKNRVFSFQCTIYLRLSCQSGKAWNLGHEERWEGIKSKKKKHI